MLDKETKLRHDHHNLLSFLLCQNQGHESFEVAHDTGIIFKFVRELGKMKVVHELRR